MPDPVTPPDPIAELRATFAWFDPELHSIGEGGIVETATGTLLGDDGAPASAAMRLVREKAAAAAAATQPASPAAPAAAQE